MSNKKDHLPGLFLLRLSRLIFELPESQVWLLPQT